MGRKRITVTENALLEALRQYGQAPAKRPPGDWHTLKELAAAESQATGTQVTPAAMKYRINMAKSRGVVIEQMPGSAIDEHGRVVRTMYYRITAKPSGNT
ncbi:MAG TPA: hypothetical protein VNL18_15570 [Gemmatimonadales bacterium]|nr:hypothetical protein [Gemmatimonadales bacterium]